MVLRNEGRSGCVSTRQEVRAERIRRRFTDWGASLLGFAIIGHQSFVLKPGEAQWPLLLVGLTLLGVPTGVAAFSQIRNGGAGGTTDSGSPMPPSSSPPEAPSSPSVGPSPASEVT